MKSEQELDDGFRWRKVTECLLDDVIDGSV